MKEIYEVFKEWKDDKIEGVDIVKDFLIEVFERKGYARKYHDYPAFVDKYNEWYRKNHKEKTE
jgi:hypothetical protein